MTYARVVVLRGSHGQIHVVTPHVPTCYKKTSRKIFRSTSCLTSHLKRYYDRCHFTELQHVYHKCWECRCVGRGGVPYWPKITWICSERVVCATGNRLELFQCESVNCVLSRTYWVALASVRDTRCLVVDCDPDVASRTIERFLLPDTTTHCVKLVVGVVLT